MDDKLDSPAYKSAKPDESPQPHQSSMKIEELKQSTPQQKVKSRDVSKHGTTPIASDEEIDTFEIKSETDINFNSVNDLSYPTPRPPTPRPFIDTPQSPDPHYTYTFMSRIL